MDNSKLKAIIATVLAIFAALYLGITAATAQIETVMWVVGGVGLSTCVLLGRRIWMLLPLMATLNLTLMIPGQPNTFMVAQVVFIGFCVLLFLTRKLSYQPAFTELGFWTLLLSLCVLQVYIRNPVGFNIFGGESIGGKPYGLLLIALASSVLLGTLRIPPPDLRWILRLSIFGGLMSFFIQSIGFALPGLGGWIGSANSGAADAGVQRQASYGEQGASRISFVRGIARNLALWIGSFMSPIRACFHPIWAPLVLLSFAFAALSGYRTEVVAVGLTYLVALAYRGGKASVALSCLVLALGLLLLGFVNLLAPLPANLQRSLSFLPGTWDQAQVRDADNSTEWRVEMWKEALLTDFWIHNKILGDGLGMTREEYNYMQSMNEKQTGGGRGSGNLTRDQEFMMAAGNYHSGPVSTIRTIGYFGLLVLLLAQIRLAVHAHRQIQRARNTEWFPLALFIGIPLIWSPFFFVFVFGTFDLANASFLMGAAMVRVLENNLPLPTRQKPVRIPYALTSVRAQ